MNLICPECKNNLNVSDPSELYVGSVLECDVCGITLEVKKINGEDIKFEVIDEGK